MAVTRSDAPAPAMATDEVHAYCRDVEAYLCRRNDGHLIRLVGPAFELVKGWAELGIPITVVREAIDRVIERAERKLTRKRPVRIEFCDGDVLDGYDRWRRAVGVVHTADEPPPPGVPKRGTLHAHVERVAVQLAVALGSDQAGGRLRPAVQTALTALDGLKAESSGVRGAARDTVLGRLAEIDRALLAAAERALPADKLTALAADAARELAPFRARLQAAQWDAAVAAARGRLVRTTFSLPIVSFD